MPNLFKASPIANDATSEFANKKTTATYFIIHGFENLAVKVQGKAIFFKFKYSIGGCWCTDGTRQTCIFNG